MHYCNKYFVIKLYFCLKSLSLPVYTHALWGEGKHFLPFLVLLCCALSQQKCGWRAWNNQSHSLWGQLLGLIALYPTPLETGVLFCMCFGTFSERPPVDNGLWLVPVCHVLIGCWKYSCQCFCHGNWGMAEFCKVLSVFFFPLLHLVEGAWDVKTDANYCRHCGVRMALPILDCS